jgi:GntR family transcriptional regulator
MSQVIGQTMQREQVTAEDITQAVLERIRTGMYKPGDRLPPVRTMAEEIGSNRNTVNKAYQSLMELGFVSLGDSRRDGYIVRQGDAAGAKTKEELHNYFFQQAISLVWQAMAAGMSAEQIYGITNNAVFQVFGHSEVKMIFFECNDFDTHEMGKQLNEVLELSVEFDNLSQFYRNQQHIVNHYDLIITTYHHLAEINTALKQEGMPTDKVISIGTRIRADSMVKIAGFTKKRIGVISTNKTTAHMVKHILFGYHPEWQLEAISMEKPKVVRELVGECDHLVVTNTSVEDVIAVTGRSPDVVVNFEIDNQSVVLLKNRINQIRLKKIQAFQSQNNA